METLRLIFSKSRGSSSGEIRSDRFEGLLNACQAIEHKTPADGWRLRLNGTTSHIVGPEPGNIVAIGTIRATHEFLQVAGLTPDTVVDFLARRSV